MKRVILPVLTAICLLPFVACDGGTSLCIEEYNCSDSWCERDYSQSLESCHRYFADRYDQCLDDMSYIQKNERESCYKAYNDLNNCIFSHTTCGESFDVYQHRVDSIEQNECREKLDKYYDVCEGRRYYY